MKIKTFSEPAKAVIEKICSLDVKQSDEELNQSITELIGEFDNDLMKELKEKQHALKDWRLKRRELSLFYELSFLASSTAGRKIPTDAKKLLNYFIDLKSGNILKYNLEIKVLMSHGLIVLDSKEIDLLIKNNV